MDPGRSLTANFLSRKKASKDLNVTPPPALLSLGGEELLAPLSPEEEALEEPDEAAAEVAPDEHRA